MVVGFLTNTVASNAIDTTYTLADAVALTNTGSAVGVGAVAGAENVLPQGVYLDHIELRGVQGVAITSINLWLSWDAAGDQPLTSEGTITPVAALTTANLIGGVVVIDAWVRPPGPVFTIYAHIKTNASTLTIPIGGIRLHFTEAFAGPR